MAGRAAGAAVFCVEVETRTSLADAEHPPLLMTLVSGKYPVSSASSFCANESLRVPSVNARVAVITFAAGSYVPVKLNDSGVPS